MGGLEEVDPYWFGWQYAIDRFHAKPEIEEALKQDKIIIFDRYMEANLIHQGAKLKGNQRKNIINFFLDLEHNVLGIPKSDLIVYLDLDPEYSRKAMKNQQRELDIHEQNLEYQHNVREVCMQLAKNLNWKVVDCLNKNMERKTREEVADEIYNISLKLLN